MFKLTGLSIAIRRTDLSVHDARELRHRGVDDGRSGQDWRRRPDEASSIHERSGR